MSRRKRISKRASKKLFKRTSGFKAINVTAPMRGGFRI